VLETSLLLALPVVILLALASDILVARLARRLAREQPAAYQSSGWASSKHTQAWAFAAWRFAFMPRRKLPQQLHRTANFLALAHVAGTLYAIALAWVLLHP
jgi:hypothetical protein